MRSFSSYVYVIVFIPLLFFLFLFFPFKRYTVSNKANSVFSFCRTSLMPTPLHPQPSSWGPAMCRAVGPTGSSSLFQLVDNRPAQGMERCSSRASAILPLQLLLAATATGVENLTYHFVMMSIVVSTWTCVAFCFGCLFLCPVACFSVCLNDTHKFRKLLFFVLSHTNIWIHESFCGIEPSIRISKHKE